MSVFFIKIYDFFLCKDNIADLDYDSLFDEKFALTIKYWRNIKSAELVESSLEEINRNYEVSEQQADFIVKS